MKEGKERTTKLYRLLKQMEVSELEEVQNFFEQELEEELRLKSDKAEIYFTLIDLVMAWRSFREEHSSEMEDIKFHK